VKEALRITCSVEFGTPPFYSDRQHVSAETREVLTAASCEKQH
jgi:hypothetical protein